MLGGSKISWAKIIQKFFVQSFIHSVRTKHNLQTKTTLQPNNMTLIKCISLTALLSGVSTVTGDTTDNVSSRLQVHVRDNKWLGVAENFLSNWIFVYLVCIICCIFPLGVFLCPLWCGWTWNRAVWRDVQCGRVYFQKCTEILICSYFNNDIY